MLAATGKDQRQASRILPGVTSGACHVAAGIVRLRRRPLRGCSGPGGHLGRVARHVDDEANGAASLKQFRHRFAIVCLRGPQSRGKCGNPRQCGDLGPARDFAADRRHSPVEGSRLKIVVSPVRVRVSPLAKALQNRIFRRSKRSRQRRANWAQDRESVPKERIWRANSGDAPLPKLDARAATSHATPPNLRSTPLTRGTRSADSIKGFPRRDLHGPSELNSRPRPSQPMSRDGRMLCMAGRRREGGRRALRRGRGRRGGRLLRLARCDSATRPSNGSPRVSLVAA